MSGGDGLITLTIDGREVQVPSTIDVQDPDSQKSRPFPTTIYDAANRLGIEIPTLCHREYMTPVAVCRVCVVDVGGRVLAPACQRRAEQGMVVKTHHTSDKVRTTVSVLTEILMSDHPAPCAKHSLDHSCELELLAEKLDVKTPRFYGPSLERKHDNSSIVIKVDHNSCILCDRCVRGCNEIRHNEIIGRRGRGYSAGIAFDLDSPMGESACVECGECMVSCPTGALTLGGFQTRDLKQIPNYVPTSDLADHPLFQGVSRAFLRLNEGSVRRVVKKDGEVICREGESGSTAYYIDSGKVEIRIVSPLKHAKSLATKGGLLKRFATVLVGRDQDRRDADGLETSFIPIDAPVSLKYGDPVATLEPGDIFGEMTCMSNYPRSATVRAIGDCTLLEFDRNVLSILQRNKASKAMIDDRYRTRSIDTHLRSVPEFGRLPEDKFKSLVDYLRPRVELVRYNPGQAIFRQGDPADHFYLVRIGFVKVSQERSGGERVLSYIGRGGFFGEIAFLSQIPEIAEKAPPGVRTATCSALDDVDLVKIPGEVFREVLTLYPEVKAEYVKIARERLLANVQAMREVETVPLGNFLEQGLMEAKNLLVLDLEKCTRCDECTKACSDAHDGITRLIRDGLRFDKYLVASSCRSCLDPYCMVGCPVGSIHRGPSGEIRIENHCIGCGKCAENCPYGNINMHGFDEGKKDDKSGLPIIQQKATTCDLCASLDGLPSCVYACPHDAAHRMKGSELLASVRG